MWTATRWRGRWRRDSRLAIAATSCPLPNPPPLCGRGSTRRIGGSPLSRVSGGGWGGGKAAGTKGPLPSALPRKSHSSLLRQSEVWIGQQK
ncbi:hypothetical protein FZ938_27940 [Azospirillum oryzae]|nr:hypothetical protein FZ938_27940 [Azospirillum oryzae]